MSATVNYASIPITNSARLTLASTSRTVPANPGVIFDPGANGGQCHRVNIARLGDTTQTALRIFRYDGAVYHLLFEVQIGPLVMSGSLADPGMTLEAVSLPEKFPIGCKAGDTLRASINDAQTGLEVSGEGGGC